tara:strand:- start:1270 stop:4245 length:2976 start_codon:yes stop_codon:yes gene_type:complete
MPKKVHVINSFEGGQNSSADPRDIEANEAVSIKNLSTNRFGRLVMSGKFTEHEATLGTLADGGGQEENKGANDYPGTGLFYFPSDYKMLDASGARLTGASDPTGAADYFLLYHKADGETHSIFQRLADGTLDWSETSGNSDIDLGGNSADSIFYNADGNIRIFDAPTTGAARGNTNKWHGVITPKIYGNHQPRDNNGVFQTWQAYGDNFTRNEASVYRTSNASGTNDAGSKEARWMTLNQELSGAFTLVGNDDQVNPGFLCNNAIICNTESKAVSAHGMEAAGFAFADETTDLGATHFSSNSNVESGMHWGVGIHFREGQNGTWMPSTNTRYKFYITTMYDDMTQESLPQLMAMYGAQHLVPDYKPTSCDVSSGSNVIHDDNNLFLAHGFAVGQTVTVTDEDNASNTFASAYISAVDADEMTLLDGPSGSPQNFGVTESNYNKITIKGHDDCDYTAVATANDNVSFAYSTPSTEIYMCDGDTEGAAFEGNCNKFGTPGLNLRAWFNPIIKINGAEHGGADSGNNPAESNNYIFGNGDSDDRSTYGNPRISGFRIYFASNEDGYTTLWQMMEADFVKGLKAIGLDGASGDSGFAPWQHYSIYPNSDDGGTESVHSTTTGIYLKADWPRTNRWLNPPRFVSYFTNNAHEHDDVIKLDSAASIVVSKRRAYAGNVVQTIDGVQERHPDRILKSPVNQFDKFPSKSFIECAVNDGEAIVHLAAFADRLLQFNKKTLYIINIAQESEFMETKHSFKGVTHSSAVCTTDLGVAWANENGAYFYDGQKVIDILESKGQIVIPEDEWSTFADEPMAGYIPKTRQVIFADSKAAGSGKTFIYDIMTNSFTRGTTQLVSAAEKSNFINDYNSDLVYYDYTNNQMMKWNTTAATSNDVEYITKDIDFGNPSVRKKIYKVYITYKGNGTFPTVTYGVNGDSTPTTAVTTVTAMSNNNDWATAEYKFGSDANNCYSFQLKLAGNAPADFEINDISIVYREKRVK